MAEPILYMGKSGTGKSTSLRNLDPKSTIIIQPNAKSLPFPGGDANFTGAKKNRLITNELDKIQGTIAHISKNMPEIKCVVLEDFTHFFSARIFSKKFMGMNSGNEAFQRWNVFGASVYQSLFAQAQDWRTDLYIVVIHHTEVKDDGTVGFKSAGKLLDNTIDFPSYFNYIFHGVTIPADKGVKYEMLTNMEGSLQAKTPFGAFPDLYINNDMKAILDRISLFKAGKVEVVWK
jgi:hypothetical protein